MPLTQREQDLIRVIDRRKSELIADLRDLVAIPSASSNLPALDQIRVILTARLERLGATITLVPGTPRPQWLYPIKDGAAAPLPHTAPTPPTPPTPPTAICTRVRPKGTTRANILLSGHLDTVHPPQGAFRELTISGDRATGPGCADMKGGLLVAIAALEALEELGIDASWTFALNSDEETGSFCSEAALAAACEGPAPHDCALVFEPALPGGDLVIERPGSGQFFIECTGKSAHVGRDFASGVSAVTALAHVLTKVPLLADPAAGKIASVGPIEGNHATNAVPDRARAWGNVRFANAEAQAALTAGLDALASQPGASSDDAPLPKTRVQYVFNRAGKPTTPAVLALAYAARRVSEDLGMPMPFASTGGVCDGNIFQGQGLPTIDTLGVRGGGLHTTDEWIDLTSLTQRASLAAILIARLSERGVPRGSDQETK
jgi:glutamate carboxypeptidase